MTRARRPRRNPVEIDKGNSVPIKRMKELGWSTTALGPWLPGVQNRLVKAGEKLRATVRVILPDQNNRFTIEQITPQRGIIKLLVSAENPGPHELKGVNFWHRIFDQASGFGCAVVPEDSDESKVDLSGLKGVHQHFSADEMGYYKEINRRLEQSKYNQRIMGILDHGRPKYSPTSIGKLVPIVRSNLPDPKWGTSDDIQADATASILGLVRGLRLSVVSPGEIYRFNRSGLSRTEYSRKVPLFPTDEEHEELRKIIAPLEQRAQDLLQLYFQMAADQGLVLLLEQGNAAISTLFAKESDPSYQPLSKYLKELFKHAKPPPGMKFI